MADMTYSGRIYQNPIDRREIWVNVGWNAKGAQLWPLYEPGLAEYCSEAQWNKIIEAMKKEFENAPFHHVCEGWCAMALCCGTCGILFCPCVYIKVKSDQFAQRLRKAVAEVSGDHPHGVRLELTESASTAGAQWLDSNSQVSNVSPPLGWNLILKSKEPQLWPPAKAHIQARAPIQAEMIGGKFCTKCGTNLDASAAFCSKCGTRQPELLDELGRVPLIDS